MMEEQLLQSSTFIGTANRGYGQQAQEEIIRLFGPPFKFSQLVPNETFRFELPLGKAEATQRLVEQEPMFLRHIQPVDAELDWDGELDSLLEWATSSIKLEAGTLIAVQVRKTEQLATKVSQGEYKQALDLALTKAYATEPVAKGGEFILSLYLTPEKAYIGLSAPEHNLSDWSGGAIRFRKEEGQLSRAKFKLLEAEQVFGLDFSQYKMALDVGAAPGGWTSLLLERGVKVTAIDPAKLDKALLKHPNLTFHQKNASDVKLLADAYELLVCDMSWSPRQMARLIKELLPSLRTGGTAILTVKLMHKKAFQTVRELVGDLSPELSLQKGKQLFHNREELTLFFIKS
ncbi:methyltransferase domain-containing protein [Paenibacillus sp. S3N08]|uniref:Methyltransferase domain-containing protein n=2 Tax=Paenibacillus agricola TaxID=2716264 RepID=A0ABX0J3J6_9BACL|nr:methyltransferase domain-containing protein [Paenibacillus agricola]